MSKNVTLSLLATIATGLVLASPAIGQTIAVPADTAALGYDAIAATHWGGEPCGGQIDVRWEHLGSAINAHADWYGFKGQPATYTACVIRFNLDVEWDAAKLCTIDEHERGHLMGHDHDDSVLMNTYYVGPTPECTPAQSSAPQKKIHRTRRSLSMRGGPSWYHRSWSLEIGAQDDGAIVQNAYGQRDAVVAQMRDAGVTRVRFILWPTTDRAQLDDAMHAVRAAGLNVHLTLASPSRDPETVANWSAAAAARYAPWVNSFSIGNEPDLALSRDQACDLTAKGISTTIRRVRVRLRYSNHVRRISLGTRIVVFRGTVAGRRVKLTRVRAVRGRGRARHYISLYYRTVLQTRRVVTAATSEPVLPARICGRIAAGELYRRIVLATAPAIRAAAPGARILTGETSPIEPVTYFMSAVGDLPVDGWAHHAYQNGDPETSHIGGTGIGDLERVHSLTGLPVYVTEFGYHRTTEGTPADEASDRYITQLIPRAFAVARDGARMLTWTGWTAPPAGWAGTWDTGLGIVDGSEATLAAFAAASR